MYFQRSIFGIEQVMRWISGFTNAGRCEIESATDSRASHRRAVLRRIQGKNDTPRSGADCGDCRADSEQHQRGIHFPGLWQLPARSTVDRGRRSPHDPPGWSLSWNHHETPSSSSAAWNEWVMSGFRVISPWFYFILPNGSSLQCLLSISFDDFEWSIDWLFDHFCLMIVVRLFGCLIDCLIDWSLDLMMNSMMI